MDWSYGDLCGLSMRMGLLACVFAQMCTMLTLTVASDLKRRVEPRAGVGENGRLTNPTLRVEGWMHSFRSCVETCAEGLKGCRS